MRSLILQVAIFILCASSIKCLDLESAKELPCFPIHKTVPMEHDKSSDKPSGTARIYYPFMSRLDLYKSATDILQKDPKEISESTVYYDACIVWTSNNGTHIAEGFDGHTREYSIDVVKEGSNQVTKIHPVEGPGASGTGYVTLSDNKTFFFTAFCANDGQMSWGVASLIPKLPEESVKKIHEHAVSLGFKKEYFTELRYDGCDLEHDE
ncbi:unnamed protein product [Orchesella dallaii]|uniref:Uncharacterized protein n=1 Tax=Orchesella dallaii TaxID=48710 RepID=A0ABP1Q1R5_9HEXA